MDHQVRIIRAIAAEARRRGIALPEMPSRSEARGSDILHPLVNGSVIETPKAREKLLEILRRQDLSRRPTITEVDRFVIVGVAEGIGRFYSIGAIQDQYEALGASQEEAEGFAVTFVAEQLNGGLAEPESAELTGDEAQALRYLLEKKLFFKQPAVPADAHVNRQYVLTENWDALPQMDQSMKLRLRYLAQHPNLVMSFGVYNTSQAEATAYLEKLLKQAQAWGLVLKSNQVAILGSKTPGFDRQQIRQSALNKLLGYLSDKDVYLRAVPLRENVEFRLVVDEELIQKTADWLLAADALLTEVPDNVRFNISTARDLARVKGLNYDEILQAVRAYTKLAVAA
ncbi:MAG: hypothetical protein NC930_07000 [Candidatus Omnitrophica bacterium]|nr:hypothetical protein [Candidatus Omnitrophota bacterium]